MKKIFLFLTIFIVAQGFSQQSDSLVYYLKIGNSTLEAKNYEEAFKYFSSAIRNSPTNAESYKMRGMTNYLMNKFNDAHNDFNQSLELNPDCSDCIFYLAKIHEKLGEKGESNKRMYDLSKQLAYNSAVNYVLSGNKQLVNSNFAEAEKEYNKAIELDSDYAEPYYQIAYIRYQDGKNTEAITLADKALNADSTYYQAYALKGSIYYNLNDLEKAILNYTSCIQYEPAYAVAYVNRGVAFYNLSKVEEACADWKKAKELGSKDLDDQMLDLCK